MSQNTSLENNKDSSSSFNDISLEISDSSEEENMEDINKSIYLLLKDVAEEYCNECKKKNKYCWCVKKKEEWDNTLRRFTGYDMYCLDCLESDKLYYEEEIKEYENRIKEEMNIDKIREYEKWIEEWKERLESTNEEVDTAKKFLKSGEYNEYHCINCDYVYYNKPVEIIYWVCDVCDKQNFLFEGTDFEQKGYYYYDKNEEKKYSKNYDSLAKMIERKYRKEHLYDQDDKYFYTDGMKFFHPHDPHDCLDCSIGYSRKNCPYCNRNIRRRRYRDYLIESLR